MLSYRVREERERILVRHIPSRYFLEVKLDTAAVSRSFLLRFWAPAEDGFVPITARDLSEYAHAVARVTPNIDDHVIDIGGGLGEFTPHHAHRPRAHLPILIDPAKYDVMRDLLKTVELPTDAHRRRREVLLERCETVLDSSRVRLVNGTLHEALVFEPSLRGSADLIVDHYGAANHPWTVEPALFASSPTGELEHALLKPGGRLIVVTYSFVYDTEALS